MRYSAFEQAAAEATLGVREVETQLEQLKSQMDQLKSKRDLLDNLSRQLLQLRPSSGEGMSSDGPLSAEAPPAPEAAPHSTPDVESEMANAGVYTPARTLREGWFTRSSDSGVRGPSSDSGLRGRL